MKCAYCEEEKTYPEDFPNMVYAECSNCYTANNNSNAVFRRGVGVIVIVATLLMVSVYYALV